MVKRYTLRRQAAPQEEQWYTQKQVVGLIYEVRDTLAKQFTDSFDSLRGELEAHKIELVKTQAAVNGNQELRVKVDSLEKSVIACQATCSTREATKDKGRLNIYSVLGCVAGLGAFALSIYTAIKK